MPLPLLRSLPLLPAAPRPPAPCPLPLPLLQEAVSELDAMLSRGIDPLVTDPSQVLSWGWGCWLAVVLLLGGLWGAVGLQDGWLQGGPPQPCMQHCRPQADS